MKTKGRKGSGQTLFEMVIVLAVAAILTTSIVGVVTISVRNSRFSQAQAQAARYAQEAAEWVRQQRDTDWAVFAAKSGNYCMASLGWTPGQCSASSFIPNTDFVRNVTITASGSDWQVDVAVSWTDSRGTHESRTSTVLTNWQRR